MSLKKELEESGFLNKQFNFRQQKNISSIEIEQYLILKTLVIKETEFLSNNTPILHRLRYIKHDINKNNIRCPVCGKNRVWYSAKTRFELTCGNKNKEHKEYIYKIILKKSKETNLKKYGKEYYQNTAAYNERISNNISNTQLENTKDLNKTFIELNFVYKGIMNFRAFMDYYKCSRTTTHKYINEFGVIYNNKTPTSRAEDEIVNFIESLTTTTIIKNSREIISPLELDIYLPEYKLAIEYNGLMFHSQGTSKYRMFDTLDKNKNIHLNKTEACEAKGIQLLHINENEWLEPAGWKSVIRNKLKKNSIKIGARKTIIKKFSSGLILNNFLNENHLQGAGAIGPIRYGLYYKDELVQLMTFSKARFSKADYELIRMCSKADCNIIGGASRLLKAFEKDHPNKTIVSYANRRWSDGGIYKTLGFTLKHTSQPNYYYFHETDTNKLWHRANFQKHKLQSKLKIYDAKLTEQQNMFNNGYRRIYDSGNFVFLK